MRVDLSPHELLVITDALRRCAIRQESESRFKPAAAGPHDRKAAEYKLNAAKNDYRGLS